MRGWRKSLDGRGRSESKVKETSRSLGPLEMTNRDGEGKSREPEGCATGTGLNVGHDNWAAEIAAETTEGTGAMITRRRLGEFAGPGAD